MSRDLRRPQRDHHRLRPGRYTAAIYAARANLEPLVFEGAVTAGGALMNTTEVENFPGFRDGIMGPDLMDEHARAGRALRRRDGHRRRRLRATWTGDVKVVTDSRGQRAPGPRSHPRDGLGLPRAGPADEKRLSGHGVSWCATCDGFFFRDQDIAVVGGGDSAVEEATFLTKFARSVTLVHRRHELRASPIMADRALSNPKIRFAWNSAVDAIHGEDKLSGITLRDTVTGATRELAVTGLFVAIGHDPRNELIKGVVDARRRGVRPRRGPFDADEHPRRVRLRRPRRPHLPPGRSLRPAPAAPPPSTPSGSSPTEGVGPLRDHRPQTIRSTPSKGSRHGSHLRHL